MKWTEQQQTAIDARGASFIVSAAAGSGKTAVLTERLVELLADPDSGVQADRIVAVTFTKAAAADLQKKLDKRLREIISQRSGDRHLLKQQILLQSANISTIDSFCFNILRDNITDQGITSGFAILDESDEKVIRKEAMDELFDHYSREDYDKISYLYDKFCVSDEGNLVNVINSVDRFLSSMAEGERWLDAALNEYNKPFDKSVYFEALFEDVQRKLRIASSLAEENISSIADTFSDPADPTAEKALVQAQEDMSRVECLLTCAENRRFPDADDIAYAADFKRIVTIGKKTIFNEAVRELFKQRRERIKTIVRSVTPGFSSAPRDFEESRKVMECLIEVVKCYRRLIWERKCAKNAISFDDGERLVLELLGDFDENGRVVQSETAQRIADHYDIILVDEYQDSNNKQDLIFKLISKGFKHDSKGRPMYGRNAFVVGDVKQSIYRFRLANPKNFIEVMESAEPYDPDSPSENKMILLNMNFRSSPEVIGFVNFIFGELMTRRCGDVDYTDGEKLYYGAAQYGEPDEGRLAHITFFDDETADDDLEEGEKMEAELTADKIAEMLKKGEKVRERSGSERACVPGDFTVLVRTKEAVRIYAEALEKRGISTRGKEEKGFLRSREIAVLTDLLRVIANPLKDIPIAAVMVSPMYPFEIRDLALLKAQDRDAHLFTLVRDAANGALPGVSDELCARCGEFLRSIDGFRLNAVTMTIAELISSIYDTTDFVSVMQQYTDGEKKRANLRLLIQYAKNYESSSAADGSGGLSGFVSHLDRIMESGDYEQSKMSEAIGDKVVVQTLHKSKGLEYPFVFMAELSRKFKFDSEKVICSDDGRIGFVLCEKEYKRRYRTFQQMLLTSELRRDTISEELRLVYVGLTRAKQQLFINLKVNEQIRKSVTAMMSDCVINGDISGLSENVTSFADWFWLALMMHGDFPKIAELTGIECSSMGFPAADVDERLFECELISQLKSSSFDSIPHEKAKPDSRIVEELTEFFASEYDRALSETPAKLSVTQIAKKFNDDSKFSIKLRRPRFLSEKTKLTGAERGTAIHTFFQYCDFAAAQLDVQGEIIRLTEKGFLTRAQAKSIDENKIRGFFSSGLYMKICASVHVEREKKFTVAAADLGIKDEVFDRLKDSDGMIKGIIDLIYEEEDGYVIVDYKSDRGTSAKALRERYRKQLEIYKAAIELTTSCHVKGMKLYSIELMKEIEV